jgi:hypothetical protein
LHKVVVVAVVVVAAAAAAAAAAAVTTSMGLKTLRELWSLTHRPMYIFGYNIKWNVGG